MATEYRDNTKTGTEFKMVKKTKVKRGTELMCRDQDGNGIKCVALSTFTKSKTNRNELVSVMKDGGVTVSVRIGDLFLISVFSAAENSDASLSSPVHSVDRNLFSPSSKASSSSPKSPDIMVLTSLDVKDLALDSNLDHLVRKFESALVSHGMGLCHFFLIRI